MFKKLYLFFNLFIIQTEQVLAPTCAAEGATSKERGSQPNTATAHSTGAAT